MPLYLTDSLPQAQAPLKNWSNYRAVHPSFHTMASGYQAHLSHVFHVSACFPRLGE